MPTAAPPATTTLPLRFAVVLEEWLNQQEKRDEDSSGSPGDQIIMPGIPTQLKLLEKYEMECERTVMELQEKLDSQTRRPPAEVAAIAAEIEMLRALASAIECPMPPVLPGRLPS